MPMAKFSPKSPFVAHVYEDDYRDIQKLVQQYPEIETGGDLFGLWQDDKTVVIQLFIGPGEKCERTTTSFHQDIDYLRRVGSVITSEEGLCNVGEWHSHHQIEMPEPSAADRRTVFNNMPQLGLERFVLFIATIGNTRSSGQRSNRSWEVKLDQINLRCFFFLGSTHKMVNGKIEIIKGSNPHRIHNKALREIEHGAEEIPPTDSYPPEKAPKSSDEESAPQPSRNKKPDKTKPEETAQPAIDRTLAEGCGASKPARQPQGVPPQPTLSCKTKHQNVKEKGTSTPPVSRDLKPKDDQQYGRRVQDQNADKDRSTEDKENQAGTGTQRNIQSTQPSSHMSPPPYYPQQAGQESARGQGSQGNMSRSTPRTSQTAQHSSRTAQGKPGSKSVTLTGLTAEGFY